MHVAEDPFLRKPNVGILNAIDVFKYDESLLNTYRSLDDSISRADMPCRKGSLGGVSYLRCLRSKQRWPR